MQTISLLFFVANCLFVSGNIIDANSALKLIYSDPNNQPQGEQSQKVHIPEFFAKRLIFSNKVGIENPEPPALKENPQPILKINPIDNDLPPIILAPQKPRAILFIRPFVKISDQEKSNENIGDTIVVKRQNEAESETKSDAEKKTKLKEFFLNLINEDKDALNNEQNPLPDYENLLSRKPFLDSLLIEKALLSRVGKLEKLIEDAKRFNALQKPDITPIDAQEEERYTKDFYLRIMEVKTAVLNFLNWRTARRLRNLYSGVTYGKYEHQPLPMVEFYKEVKDLLRMVRLADSIVELEKTNAEKINSIDERQNRPSVELKDTEESKEDPAMDRPIIIINKPNDGDQKPIDETKNDIPEKQDGALDANEDKHLIDESGNKGIQPESPNNDDKVKREDTEEKNHPEMKKKKAT